MNNSFKKLIAPVAVVSAVATLIVMASAAPTVIGVLPAAGVPVLNSALYNGAANTVTNAHFGVATNGIWPNSIIGGDIVTNFTAIAVPPTATHCSVQLTAGASASNGAVTGQTVVLTLYRSVSGGSPTNAVGTGLFFDTLGTVTLTATSSTSGPWTSCSNFLNQTSPLGDVSTIYIGKLDASTLTNAVSLTNYNVFVNFK